MKKGKIGDWGAPAISHNTWIHRIAGLAVKPLVKTPVTPNHLTTLRLLTGLGAAGLFATGAQPWLYYGAGLFVFSMLLDTVRHSGVAALIATHNTDLAARMDRVLTLRDGIVEE